MMHSRLCVVLLVASSGLEKANGGFLEDLFARPQTVDEKRNTLKAQIDTLYQMTGHGTTSLWDKTSEIEEGKRAAGCVASLAGINLEEKIPAIPLFDEMLRELIYEQFYSVYSGPGRVDRICEVAQRRRKLLTALNDGSGKTNSKDPSNLRGRNRRELGTPNSAEYPATSSSGKYTEWATKTIMTNYMNGRNLTSHTNVDSVVTLVLDPLMEVRNDAIDDGLAITEAAFEIVCNILGMVEVGFDPGDACRIITASMDFVMKVNEAATNRLQTELDRINTHDRYIDSAQVGAAHGDAAMLVTKLT